MKERDIFAELTEGFDALKLQREDKLTPPIPAPTHRHLKTGNKAAQTQRPSGAAIRMVAQFPEMVQGLEAV